MPTPMRMEIKRITTIIIELIQKPYCQGANNPNG